MPKVVRKPRRVALDKKVVVEEEEPLRCEICGAPLMPTDEWMRRYYWDVKDGKIPLSEHFDELEDLVDRGLVKVPERRSGEMIINEDE